MKARAASGEGIGGSRVPHKPPIAPFDGELPKHDVYKKVELCSFFTLVPAGEMNRLLDDRFEALLRCQIAIHDDQMIL